MNEKTVGDFIVERLAAWGVKRIFGYSGDGINGFMGGLERNTDRISFVQVPHEELASFMACAHAKFTGEVGVCTATSGPGATHLLTGLYDAKMDHQPVVAIVGQQATFSMGGHFQQEVDLMSVFKDVAGEYVQTVRNPMQTRHVIDRAVRIALASRTVTCVILPRDVQEMPMKQPEPQHGAIFSGVGYSAPRIVPQEADLARAADVLNAGTKVAILAGQGALKATEELIAFANTLGAGIGKAFLGKSAVPDDLPFVTGAVGYIGTFASQQMFNECDTFVMVGSNMPYTEYLPKEGQARSVQIDIDGRMESIRYPIEVNLIGDSAETLRALMPLLHPKTDSGWRQQIESWVRESWQQLEQHAMHPADPINPQRIFWELSSRLPDGAILTTDSGTGTAWLARHVKIRQGMMTSVSGTLASMGSGVPYAIAAKFAYPDRPVIALVGDGAMQMTGNNALLTIAKYWRQWADPRLIVLVLNNRDLNFVTWEQRTQAGMPKFSDSQDLPDFAYDRYADLIGLTGLRMDAPEQIAGLWDKALAASTPVVINAMVDANVPVLPPKILPTLEQKFVQALKEGDVDASAVITQVAQENPALAAALRRA